MNWVSVRILLSVLGLTSSFKKVSRNAILFWGFIAPYSVKNSGDWNLGMPLYLESN